MSTQQRKLIIGFLLTIILITLFVILFLLIPTYKKQQEDFSKPLSSNSNPSDAISKDFFSNYNLNTNTVKKVEEIELSRVISGGPGKDGIPAITEPLFSSLDNISESNPNLKNDHLGILIKINDEIRFYPYNILVWHELVNDTVEDQKILISFCPLCGSAIVYDRTLDGQVLEFGVSGLLYESNLLMYDRKTESLWSQIEGRSVIGNLAGSKLSILPMQILTFKEAKDLYSNMQILSERTGYSRDYKIYPYGDYNESDQLYFNVTYLGDAYDIWLKEPMFALNYNNQPIALVLSDLKIQNEAIIVTEDGSQVKIASTESGIIAAVDDQEIPGFYTQWFSWANHNLKKGVNGDKNAIVWPENRKL